MGDEAERGLYINRKGTLNIPIVFIMQTTVNKLKKKKKLGRWHCTKDGMIAGGHRFKTVESLLPLQTWGK